VAHLLLHSAVPDLRSEKAEVGGRIAEEFQLTIAAQQSLPRPGLAADCLNAGNR